MFTLILMILIIMLIVKVIHLIDAKTEAYKGQTRTHIKRH